MPLVKRKPRVSPEKKLSRMVCLKINREAEEDLLVLERLLDDGSGKNSRGEVIRRSVKIMRRLLESPDLSPTLKVIVELAFKEK